MEYPKYKYHATEAPVIVHSQEDEDALDSGWKNSPADFEVSSSEELKLEAEATAQDDAKKLARVDLATAQMSVRKATVKKALLKSSGIDGDAGDWTETGDGKDYPGANPKSGADPVKGAN